MPSHVKPYLEDILSGFALIDSTKGNLITLSLTDKMLLVWDVEIKPSDITEIKYELNNRKSLLDQARKTRNFELLTPIYEECPYCPYNYLSGCPYGTKTS